MLRRYLFVVLVRASTARMIRRICLLCILAISQRSAAATLLYKITWDGGFPAGTQAWPLLVDTGPFPRELPSSVETALQAFPGSPTIEPDENAYDGALLLHAAYEGISLQ